MANKKNNFPDSFGDARRNFQINLKTILSCLDYTPAAFALKLNTLCENSLVAAGDIYDWLHGDSIPCVYHLYKIMLWLDVDMGHLFSYKHNFSTLVTTAPPINTPLKTNALLKEDQMTNTNTVTISRTNKNKMIQVVTARTTSKNYNLLLANKIWSSDMLLKDVATKVHISTRSLRDYAFGGSSVPANVAQALVKLFKTSYHSLGLKLNQDTGRYEALSVKVKA